VVSVAGPNVESLISGRGAGAAHYSQVHYTTVTNVDIGGGSANSAIFKSGAFVAAAAMNYGGRILELEPESGRVRHIAAPAPPSSWPTATCAWPWATPPRWSNCAASPTAWPT
jgi:ethanolamine utilization protein EutA